MSAFNNLISYILKLIEIVYLFVLLYIIHRYVKRKVNN